MSQLVANCPRCKSVKITFDLISDIPIAKNYDWQRRIEAFCICRNCSKATIFILSQSLNANRNALANTPTPKLAESVNNYYDTDSYISLKDFQAIKAPEHLPENILNVFNEAAICLTVNCFNAAGVMFRLCIDIATKQYLPAEDTNGLNHRTRRDLGLRLPWLFKNELLPKDLEELSHCIKEDGNDGAHAGTLQKEDVEDLLDFTITLLERLVTEPRKIEIAKERRQARRDKK